VQDKKLRQFLSWTESQCTYIIMASCLATELNSTSLSDNSMTKRAMAKASLVVIIEQARQLIEQGNLIDAICEQVMLTKCTFVEFEES
jgi:hypothetical protein